MTDFTNLLSAIKAQPPGMPFKLNQLQPAWDILKTNTPPTVAGKEFIHLVEVISNLEHLGADSDNNEVYQVKGHNGA